MSHFAQINSDNIVVNVIVAEQEFIDSGAVGDPATWIQTDLNTRGGVHYDPATRQPSVDQSKALRMNAAVAGSFYDTQRDAFIPPRPDDIAYVFDEARCCWAPTRVAPKN
jgi:hypothetical protein